MFRFTIRDVLWLMVVVAVSVSWWIDRRWLRDGYEYRALVRTIDIMRQELIELRAKNENSANVPTP